MVMHAIKVDTVTGAGLIDVHRQIKYATMRAINNVAFLTKEAEREEMIRKFDRPTPFVLNGLRVKKADVAGISRSGYRRYIPNSDLGGAGVQDGDIVAEVFFNDEPYKQSSPPSIFMAPHTHWGYRKEKRFEALLKKAGIMQSNEYAIPTRHIKTDRYGNPSRGQMTQMLSYFRAFPESGYVMNRNIAKRANVKKPRPETQFFVGKSDNGRYRAIFTRKAKTRQILPIWIFIDRVPTYKKVFDFWGVAEKTMVRHFDAEFDKQFKDAMATAKRYY